MGFGAILILDDSRRSRAAQRRNTQFYLLAKPLVPKRVDLADLQQTFKRIWTLIGKFKVQASLAGLFLFSFDLRRDRIEFYGEGHGAPLEKAGTVFVQPLQPLAAPKLALKRKPIVLKKTSVDLVTKDSAETSFVL
ncbi:hypothetical protein ACLB2K_004406 [Fragaria x ananassa]